VIYLRDFKHRFQKNWIKYEDDCSECGEIYRTYWMSRWKAFWRTLFRRQTIAEIQRIREVEEHEKWWNSLSPQEQEMDRQQIKILSKLVEDSIGLESEKPWFEKLTEMGGLVHFTEERMK